MAGATRQRRPLPDLAPASRRGTAPFVLHCRGARELVALVLGDELVVSEPALVQVLEGQRCLADRMAVLPDHPPFRGRARFETDEAWRLYRLAREERDAKARAKAFEDACHRCNPKPVTESDLAALYRASL